MESFNILRYPSISSYLFMSLTAILYRMKWVFDLSDNNSYNFRYGNFNYLSLLYIIETKLADDTFLIILGLISLINLDILSIDNSYYFNLVFCNRSNFY